MKLSAPKGVTFVIALVLGLVAILWDKIAVIKQLIPPVVGQFLPWLLPVAFVLLVLACIFKGL